MGTSQLDLQDRLLWVLPLRKAFSAAKTYWRLATSSSDFEFTHDDINDH
jgi:hypothetical protein